MTALRQVDESAMTLKRRRAGRGFTYIDQDDRRVTDEATIKRLKALVIPPMWEDVMICRWDDGHVQATGRDLKGRKQYIYHSRYEQLRQQEKFDRLAEFGAQLEACRAHACELLKQTTWGRESILALLVLVLDQTGIRIGNQQYTDRNGTYGLTTLRRKHMTLEEQGLRFDFQGKSARKRQVSLDDPVLVDHIRRSAEQPGYELFRYQDAQRRWQNIDSEDVNAFIRESMGEQFSSKDFRTWVASRLAFELYPDAVTAHDQSSRGKLINHLLRAIADELGNTPSVCRDYYVHPAVIQCIDNNRMAIVTPESSGALDPALSPAERALLSVIATS